MRERLEIRVEGRVQGVAFRWSTQRTARALGLTGWVRNLADGAVRIVAEGERPALERLLAWSEHGPDRARVTHREVSWSEPGQGFSDFAITG